MAIINTRASLLASGAEPQPAAKPHYTLAEFNQQQAQMYERLARAREDHPNNIACPTCGAELWDTAPIVAYLTNAGTIDPSNPPLQTIECRACHYQGVRLA